MKPHLISLDRERTLKYGANAIADFECIFGTTLSRSLQVDAGINWTRVMLWAGLRQTDQNLSVQDVGNLFDVWIEKGGKWYELTTIIMALLIEAGWIPNPEEKETKAPDPNQQSPAAGAGE